MQTFLQIDNLEVSYGAGPSVIRRICLSLYRNEMLAVLGANGAGKSTLLRAISGILPTKAGRVLLDSVDISHWSPNRRVETGLIHVPEGRQMLGGLTVAENLLMGAYIRRRERRAALEETTDEIYQLFPILKERRRQLAGSLSGGQQQMLALGRALMGKPRILMCDEPSLGVAPRVTDEIFSVIGRLRDRGIPVLLVEQNAKKALSLADRAIIIKRGEIILAGPAPELRANPSLSASYLGA
jgi:branched-chain amino acid transport system ATP-binding protein